MESAEIKFHQIFGFQNNRDFCHYNHFARTWIQHWCRKFCYLSITLARKSKTKLLNDQKCHSRILALRRYYGNKFEAVES